MPIRRQHIENALHHLRILRSVLVDRQGRPRFLSGKALPPARKARITPAQWGVLAVVLRREHVGIKEIAKELHITSSAATQLVDELVGKKYLARTVNPEDRRGLSLKIPEPRKKMVQALRERRIEEFLNIFRNLTDAELAQFAALCGKIADGLSKKKSRIHDRRG